MQQLFIADLHLSPDHPRLVRGFLDLLIQYESAIDQLYIVGDWFEAWLGDDDHSAWLDGIVKALQQFVAHGTQVFFMHGNRDFTLGQQFMQRFDGQLIRTERLTIKNAGLTVVLEHGDALCTDDISYQRFKKIIRNPLVMTTLLHLPLTLRRKVAQQARQKSKASHQHKSAYIMDVNEQAVATVLNQHDVLLHGHTHRPAIHEYSNGKKRVVLGDWREPESTASLTTGLSYGSAMIALLNEHGLQLLEWKF
ncbi:MAG: UDP-2,3-diacylglucosamine diphosphatase [Moraxellaceae bacterium]|nr:MAG: UDP-2,3-diacylglucosamine diphosphatase [Moraxellaceae bacterium]